jgi:hypothetical protein
LAGVDGILEYGASLFWRKMMKRRKHRSKPLQFTGDSRRINRVRIESNVIIRSRFDILECTEVRVFIREQNMKNLCFWLEFSRKV